MHGALLTLVILAWCLSVSAEVGDQGAEVGQEGSTAQLLAPESARSRPLPKNTTAGSRCGVSEGGRIVGGTEAVGVYPWFVALTSPPNSPRPSSYKGSLLVECGATVVSQYHLISAAHCYDTGESDPKKWARRYVLVYNLVNRCKPPGKANKGPQALRVNLHPNYGREDLRNDIAVITLNGKLNLVPACLPTGRSTEEGTGLVMGFGSTWMRAATTQYPCILNEANVTVLTRERCLNTPMGWEVDQLPGAFCAGKLEGGVDSCNGDSGGPLLSKNTNGRYYIRGIVSYGRGCAREGLPGVYTDVGYYLPWIKRIIQMQIPKRPSKDKGYGVGSAAYSGFFGSKPYTAAFANFHWPTRMFQNAFKWPKYWF